MLCCSKQVLWCAYSKTRNYSDCWKENGSIKDHKGEGRKIEILLKPQEKTIPIQTVDRWKAPKLPYNAVLVIINNIFITVKAPYKIKVREENRKKLLILIGDLNWDALEDSAGHLNGWESFSTLTSRSKYEIINPPEESTDNFSMLVVQQGDQKLMLHAALRARWEFESSNSGFFVYISVCCISKPFFQIIICKDALEKTLSFINKAVIKFHRS